MYVKINVLANAKREDFKIVKENHFEVCVKEKAERNMANKRVVELVARHFGIREKAVRIINGHTSPTKMLSVDIEN